MGIHGISRESVALHFCQWTKDRAHRHAVSLPFFNTSSQGFNGEQLENVMGAANKVRKMQPVWYCRIRNCFSRLLIGCIHVMINLEGIPVFCYQTETVVTFSSRCEYECDFSNLMRVLKIVWCHAAVSRQTRSQNLRFYWSVTGKSEGSGNEIGLKQERMI